MLNIMKIHQIKKILNLKLEFKVVRISKYKNIFDKGYTPNWSEEAFVINKIKNTVPWTSAINDLNLKKLIKKNLE